MNLYIDSSAWAKVFLEEAGADDVADLWDHSNQVFCISIGYLEVTSVIARRLAGVGARNARAEFDDDWDEVETIVVDGPLIVRATEVIDSHRLRTFDALHLAAAIELGDTELVFATWDTELAEAARAEGLATAP